MPVHANNYQIVVEVCNGEGYSEPRVTLCETNKTIFYRTIADYIDSDAVATTTYLNRVEFDLVGGEDHAAVETMSADNGKFHIINVQPNYCDVFMFETFDTEAEAIKKLVSITNDTETFDFDQDDVDEFNESGHPNNFGSHCDNTGYQYFEIIGVPE